MSRFYLRFSKLVPFVHFQVYASVLNSCPPYHQHINLQSSFHSLRSVAGFISTCVVSLVFLSPSRLSISFFCLSFSPFHKVSVFEKVKRSLQQDPKSVLEKQIGKGLSSSCFNSGLYFSVDRGEQVVLEIPHLAHIPFSSASQVPMQCNEKIQGPTDMAEPDNQVQPEKQYKY